MQMLESHQEFDELKRRYEELDTKYGDSVGREDLFWRLVENPNVSPVYKLMYFSLCELYPQLLEGDFALIDLQAIRTKVAISRQSASQFMQDMLAVKAFHSYEAGNFDLKTKECSEGMVVPDPEVFPYPEFFNTKATENRRRARDVEKKRRDRLSAGLVLQCSECGSDSIMYALLPTCKNCGHKHRPLENMPVERISIEPEANNVDDDIKALKDDMEGWPEE